MTRLSVNINKVATLRNARGEGEPDVIKFAIFCEECGAQGITVHPRPDERHIRRSDVYALKDVVTTEFNIEGYPSAEFMSLVEEVRPTQVTLVPDKPEALTSSAGWDVVKNEKFLSGILARLREAGIRSSIFIDADRVQVRRAAEIGADRVELYTKSYADNYADNREEAIKAFIEASDECMKCGIGMNAGHDLSLRNLAYFHKNMPLLDEVSIGHALISDALYMGIKQTICKYLECLR